MGAILVLLAIVVVLCLVVGLIVLAGRPSQPRPSRADKSRYADLERKNRDLVLLVAKIDKLAYDNRILDPELSMMIVDEISKHKGNELA